MFVYGDCVGVVVGVVEGEVECFVYGVVFVIDMECGVFVFGV